MWCPKCKTEYRDGVNVCTDCGTELVEKSPENIVDICEINDEKAADEIANYLSYSGIEGVEKKESDDCVGYTITVPASEEKRAEKLFHGYLLAKEEDKEEKSDEKEEPFSELSSKENNDGAETETEPLDKEDDVQKETIGSVSDDDLIVADEIDEDTADLVYSSTKKEYVKKADEYRDMKFSGITFIIFGIIGAVYLTLCKIDVIPITYNIVIFCIIAALFGIFIISGVVSIIKAGKIKLQIPEEESMTKSINEYLDEKITQEMIESWLDANVSDVENDLLLTAHIRKILSKEYPDLQAEYIEMIADDYFEEHFLEDSEFTGTKEDSKE